MEKTQLFNQSNSDELEEMEEDQELKELGDEELEGLGKPKNPDDGNDLETELEDETLVTEEDL